jgi:cytoskeletal protein CcmA (bactofilin family)
MWNSRDEHRILHSSKRQICLRLLTFPSVYALNSPLIVAGQIFYGNLADVDPATPGTYTTSSACILPCDLELATGTGNFVFECTGGLTIGAGVSLTQTGAGTVTWTVGANPVITGAESSVIGDITSLGAITLGALSNWEGLLTAGGAVSVGAGSTVTGNVDAFGAITVAATGKVIGTVDSEMGAVDLGANAIVEGTIDAQGAITLAASAKVSAADLKINKHALTSGAAVTLGAGAESGDIKAYGAITLGAEAKAGKLTSGTDYDVASPSGVGGTITLGAGAKSHTTTADTITKGANAEDTFEWPIA